MALLDTLTYDNLFAGDFDVVTEEITIGASQTIKRGDLLEKLVTESINSTGGAEAVKASGTITFAAAAGTVTVGETEFTYDAGDATGAKFTTAGDLAEDIDKLENVNATVAGSIITVTAAVAGVAGNAIALATTQAGGAVSVANLTGGAAATAISAVEARSVAETWARPAAVANDESYYTVASEDVTTGAGETAVTIGYRTGIFNENSMRFGGASTAADNKDILAARNIFLRKANKQ
jgi:hypothetical protein